MCVLSTQVAPRFSFAALPRILSCRTTKLPNPHYAPEVCVKVTLLNFAITQVGLEDQLLGVVIREELPEIEERKNKLVVQNAKMKAQLKGIEDKILELLSSTEGNILDNTDVVLALDNAKQTSNEIDIKVKEAEKTEKEIDASREEYRPVAFRASSLFFCVVDLAVIDPMYQYSLVWYSNLFTFSIREAPPSKDLQERLTSLINVFTYLLYENICRSLFEDHKLLFSFMLTIKNLKSQNLVDAQQWRFLISGQVSDEPSDYENPSEWIVKRAWEEMRNMSTLDVFKGFDEDVCRRPDEWKKIFDAAAPQESEYPDGWNELSQLQRMCVLRTIRPDKMKEAMQNFVIAAPGQKFIEPPPFDIEVTFKGSTNASPLLFVLSVGSDPMKALLGFAEKRNMSKKMSAIALGQGQGPIGERMIEDARGRGGGGFLQPVGFLQSTFSD